MEGRLVVAKPMRTTVTAPKVKKEPNTVQGEAWGSMKWRRPKLFADTELRGSAVCPTGVCSIQLSFVRGGRFAKHKAEEDSGSVLLCLKNFCAELDDTLSSPWPHF